jgi:hypothetical protein
MVIKILILFILLFSSRAFSQARIRELHTSTEILVDLHGAEGFFEDKKVLILSKDEDKIIGIGVIRDTEIKNTPGVVKVKIDEIVDNYLVMEGDGVELLDYRMYKEKNIPGFFSITLKGNRKVPAMFKELAYFGVFTSEGHTLDKNEVMVSPFQVQYGFSDEFGVKIVNALWLDGYANIGAKFQVLRNKQAKITLNSLGAYKVQSQDWIGQVGGVISIPSNSKFQSHFMVNVTFDPQYDNAKATKDLGLFQDSDIRSITEYITDRWNRVLYGPVYNVELQTLGGTVSHMWIWDTFHMSLGIATKDFTNLTFEKDGYYYVYDLFWRF